MKIFKYLHYLTIIILLNFNCNLALAQEIALAELRINPDIESFLDPEYFVIQISGNSNSGAVNLADIKLQFNPETLIFDSIDYSENFCEFNIFEDIDSQTGKINFICATQNASTSLNIAEIKFKKINQGWNKITLSGSRFFLNNGLGESILPITESHNFYIYK
ncbi:MAG: cohesin domain-containing protein [Patescibacteria group bacterium]|nr:cohesin domain-containing protein [Patescibacteria group bacterium]